jgi:DNA polymerase-1
VHDELVFEIPEGEIKKTVRMVSEIMENIYQMKVPLKTEAKIGPDWGSLELVSA